MLSPIPLPGGNVPLLGVIQKFTTGEGFHRIADPLEASALHRAETEEKLYGLFGEREDWPVGVREAYSQLERAQQEIQSAKEYFLEGVDNLQKDLAQPRSLDKAVEKSCRIAVGRLRKLVGTLLPEEESLLPSNFPGKPKDLFFQYDRRAENLVQQIQKAKAFPFELTDGKRENLLDILETKIPKWEREMEKIIAETEVCGAPDLTTLIQRQRDDFATLLNELRTEAANFLGMPLGNSKAADAYKSAINAKTKAGLKLELARRNLADWKAKKLSTAVKTLPDAAGLVEAAVSLVAIPPEEYAQSIELAYPPFRDRVRALIEEGKPLRRWVGGDSVIAVIFDERFGTAFHVPIQSGWILPGAKAFVPLLHGGGSADSSGKTMVQPLLKLRGRKYQCSGISFDTPNYGHAFRDPDFGNLKKYLEWLDSVFRYFRFLTRHALPIIAIGRSHGENALQEYILHYPHRLDGMIGVSGYMPGWFLANLPNFRKKVEEGDFRLNPEGFAMAMAHEGLLPVLPGGKWEELILNPHLDYQNQWTFPGAVHKEILSFPMLLLTDSDDPEHKRIGDYVRQREDFAKRRNAGFLNIPAGLHDLLLINNNRDPSPENSARIGRVYDEIGEFADKIARYWRP